MLSGKAVNVIAGPYLYTFNRWAVSWLENQKTLQKQIVSRERELNMTPVLPAFAASVRSRVIVPVFAYPTLFRMRFKLPSDYDFTYFEDKEEKVFKVNSTADGSFVMPEEPFSILDKVNFITDAGFKKILIDFSKTKVSKSQIKAIVNSMTKAQPLTGISRFNWKDGFYSPQQMEEYRAANERAAARNAAAAKPVVKKGPVNPKKAGRKGRR